MNRLLTAGLLLVATASWSNAQELEPAAPVKKAAGEVQDFAVTPNSPQQSAGTGGNTWFPVTEIDLGTFFGAEHATGKFSFENPGESEILWRGLQGSCTCAKAVVRIGDRTYELSSKPTPNLLVRLDKGADGSEIRETVKQIAIGPGEKGEVEVHLDIPNVPGPRQAHLDVHTTDERLPQFKLKWKATSAKLFVVSPAEINLNKMTWNETREFTVTVTSPLHKDFNITSMDDAGEAFDVNYEKTMNGDMATWTIHGKYGPVGSDVAGGGMLKFVTDVRGATSFTVRVMALVQGPLEVKPGGFLPFGMIRHGKELKKEVSFEPNDGLKIEATKLTFEKLTVPEEFVAVSSHNDGNKLIVEIVVNDKAPAGLLKGELVVDLNHPLVKQKRIMFNGFVR
ncbi:MAG: DUF1573 domain-containing protein [Planctomycetes bacterium]|nr:DUF1573 domain-containing protein [Planctomycetota bacterium]